MTAPSLQPPARGAATLAPAPNAGELCEEDGAEHAIRGGRLQRVLLYLSVGLIAGAVIALQIAIMRVFAVGSWAHFGSMVVSLAMLGFGLTSAVMCVTKDWFHRHWRAAASAAMLLFGLLMVLGNLGAQQLPFNPIFLVADPLQKWRLAAIFALYLLPFLAGACFLGTVFLKASRTFNRVYFADLVGAGLGGLVFLGSLYLFPPEDLISVPLILWAAAGGSWFLMCADRRWGFAFVVVVIAAAVAQHFVPDALGISKLAVSDYKGVSYARKFPDSQRVYARTTPFGFLEIYASSYLHFAPGLSDNAAFNLPNMPANAYLGLYIDGDGPSGIIGQLPPEQTGYFRFLPMYYPYLLKHTPETFVVQFGGGLSTAVALRSGSKRVTVAESNPAILTAFLDDPQLRTFTGDLLHDPRVRVIDYDGRLYLASTDTRYDVIDLSLADSAGLSNPGGFAIVEKYAYSHEAMRNYMQALNDGGILSVTLWNKEEPPKSVLKLYATMVAAAREVDGGTIADRFFVVSNYLSTTTVLYKRGGFTPAELEKLRQHTRAMSFDEVYSPGTSFDVGDSSKLLSDYRAQIFGNDAPGAAAAEGGSLDGTSPQDASLSGETAGGAPDAPLTVMPATTVGRIAWQALVHGGWDDIARQYVFDTHPLSNDRPYFAAYVRPGDLPNVLDRLSLLQDEWGYLLLWATLAIACIAAIPLVLLPVIFGWRTIFHRYPGKWRTIVYFACLGLGYIMVEVGLIADFVLALSNPTVSVSILITGMLVFSGLGSLVSERILGRARTILPLILAATGTLLIGYGLLLDRVLDVIGTLPYWLRLVACFALTFPPAFLMGFPMPTAMTSLGRLGKHHMFVWAWGINGCFSVIGAAAVPLVATAFGLSTVLSLAGGAYLVAIPAFFAILLPLTADAEVDRSQKAIAPSGAL